MTLKFGEEINGLSLYLMPYYSGKRIIRQSPQLSEVYDSVKSIIRWIPPHSVNCSDVYNWVTYIKGKKSGYHLNQNGNVYSLVVIYNLVTTVPTIWSPSKVWP